MPRTMAPQPKDITDLEEVIHRRHGCQSSYCRTVLVTEALPGHPAWDGLVKVFDLQGHPTADCCYAWTYREAGELHSVTALNEPPIDSPESAVRLFKKS